MTKIIVPTTKVKDIGELDATRILPMTGRIRKKMKTICKRCGKPVTDEYFVAGFKKGIPNMIFHEECVNT